MKKSRVGHHSFIWNGDLRLVIQNTALSCLHLDHCLRFGLRGHDNVGSIVSGDMGVLRDGFLEELAER